MKINEFIVALEKYYEMKYGEFELKIMKEYLRPQEERCEYIFKKIILSHSKKWKSLPDIALFETAISDLPKKSIYEILKPHRVRALEG